MIANTTTRSWKSASSGAKSEEIAEAGDFRYVFGAVVRVAHVFIGTNIHHYIKPLGRARFESF